MSSSTNLTINSYPNMNQLKRKVIYILLKKSEMLVAGTCSSFATPSDEKRHILQLSQALWYEENNPGTLQQSIDAYLMTLEGQDKRWASEFFSDQTDLDEHLNAPKSLP